MAVQGKASGRDFPIEGLSRTRGFRGLEGGYAGPVRRRTF